MKNYDNKYLIGQKYCGVSFSFRGFSFQLNTHDTLVDCTQEVKVFECHHFYRKVSGIFLLQCLQSGDKSFLNSATKRA